MGVIKRRSFTLIELVVAVGVVALILPSVFNILFIIIRQQLVLVAYQEIKQQGDSAKRNIKNIVQNRAGSVTDATYIVTDVCPLPLTPTPPFVPDLYVNDREGRAIHLYNKVIEGVDTVASDAGSVDPTTYSLTSPDVAISNLGFSCYRINAFTPPIISAKFTVQKSALFKEITLPYHFTIRLRNY